MPVVGSPRALPAAFAVLCLTGPLTLARAQGGVVDDPAAAPAPDPAESSVAGTAGAEAEIVDTGQRTVLDPSWSMPRQWIELQLGAIRLDFARPPVHARNLFHVSAAMYDAWAAFDPDATGVFFDTGRPSEHAACAAALVDGPSGAQARDVAIGQAAWTVLRARVERAPRSATSLADFAEAAAAQGLATDEAFLTAVPGASLGERIGRCVLAAAADDGSNEAGNHRNVRYAARNVPLDPRRPGNPGLLQPNRWQPLSLGTFRDQSGNVGDSHAFLGAEWGQVTPFALVPSLGSRYLRSGEVQTMWLDPGAPPRLPADGTPSEAYARHHTLVALWSAHLDPADGVRTDISPGAIGDVPAAVRKVTDPLEQLALYDPLAGGMTGAGHPVNPATGEPYEPNTVLRGDYTRVLAEFWADGPDSETPPGHWFRMYNEFVADAPAFSPGAGGTGLDALGTDIVAYLALGGAMHDAAVAAWSIKGAYDYVRPVSAIRFMSDLGQSSDPDAPRYDPRGLPLVPGRIELVGPDDPLAGEGAEHVDKLKVFAWRGPHAVEDPETDVAGVGWILAERWWPYQRSDFVTPPFAGYVSGHSTFSAAAATVLERLTGDAFFPGGLARFEAPADEFLEFESGPSETVRLEWATYRDAADETALSRIWGGIHPPVDDLPGRRVGATVGELAWAKVRGLAIDPRREALLLADAAPPASVSLGARVADAEGAVGATAGGSGCASTGAVAASTVPSGSGTDLSLVIAALLAPVGRAVRRARRFGSSRD